MTHFSPEDWAGFALQKIARDLDTRMQDHLDSGCASCLQALETWLGVLEVSSGLDIYSPPEHGVRFLRAIHHAFSPEILSKLQLSVARLVFPAFREQAPEGVRNAGARRRHLLFQRDNLLLDVHIEVLPETGMVSMAGQLMDPIEHNGRYSGRAVLLLSERIEWARAVTNQFGEFHFEFDPAEDLMLVVQLEEESLLVTPLPRFVLAASAGAGPSLFTE
jgi:hypothetical protein